MGFYIETPSPKGKAQQVVDLYGARSTYPMKPSEAPSDKAVLCVVENRDFDAVFLVYDDREFERTRYPDDHRPMTWLLMDKARAYEAAGYTPKEGDR